MRRLLLSLPLLLLTLASCDLLGGETSAEKSGGGDQITTVDSDGTVFLIDRETQ